MMIPRAGRSVQPKCVASARRLLEDAIDSHVRRATRELPVRYGDSQFGAGFVHGRAMQLQRRRSGRRTLRRLCGPGRGCARHGSANTYPRWPFLWVVSGGPWSDCRRRRTELIPPRRVQWIDQQKSEGKTETGPEPAEIQASHGDSGHEDVVHEGGRSPTLPSRSCRLRRRVQQCPSHLTHSRRNTHRFQFPSRTSIIRPRMGRYVRRAYVKPRMEPCVFRTLRDNR